MKEGELHKQIRKLSCPYVPGSTNMESLIGLLFIPFLIEQSKVKRSFSVLCSRGSKMTSC